MLDEPAVVGSRLASPDCARMVEVCSLVRSVFKGSAEELCGLEDHFDDVFVVLGLGGESRIRVKDEDVHSINPVAYCDYVPAQVSAFYAVCVALNTVRDNWVAVIAVVRMVRVSEKV